MRLFEILAYKRMLQVLFLFFIAFNIYFFFQFQELNEIAGKEVKILDLRFGYSLEEVNLFFEQIGSEGRLLYEKISQADMFYPFSYGLLLMSLLSFLAKGNSKLLGLIFFPVLAVIIDYVENVNIMKLMETFPEMENALVASTSTLTQVKWMFILVSIASVLILFSRNFYLKRRN